MTDSRPVSGLERVWLTAGRLLPPFAFQWVLEGEGELTPTALEQALVPVAQALPSCRARLRGVLRGSRWTFDGPLPRVRRVEAPAWAAQDGDSAPFLEEPLLGLELVLCPPGRLVIRVQHALMDGVGSTLFLQALFAALRGEALAAEEQVRDLDLLGPQDLASGPAPARDALPAVTAVPGPGRRWRRRTVPGAPSAVVPRAVSALAAFTQSQGNGHVRIDLPVDLRRHRPGLRASANLTGLLRLDLPPGAGPEQVRRLVDQGLGERSELQPVRVAERLRSLPLWLLAAVGRSEVENGQRIGRYAASATLSSLGRLDLDALSCPGWRCTRAFVIPPASPDLPLLVTMVGTRAGVELCGTCPGEADPGPALDAIAAGLGQPC